MKLVLLLATAVLAGAVPALAQTTVPATPTTVIVVPFGNTVTRTATIQLGQQLNVMPIVPFAVEPPVTFTVGTRLQLLAQPPGTKYGPVQWVKDGKPLAATGDTLEFASSSAADSGAYYAVVKDSDGGTSISAQANVLIARQGQRLLNVSARVRLDAAQPSFVSGFVVEPGPSGTLVLVRAVGPALAAFGVKDALAAPQVRLFDARGQPFAPNTFPFAFPSVSQASQRVGAFPFPASSNDVAQLFYLAPGAYTAQLSAGDGGSGTALLEIYEVPL